MAKETGKCSDEMDKKGSEIANLTTLKGMADARWERRSNSPPDMPV